MSVIIYFKTGDYITFGNCSNFHNSTNFIKFENGMGKHVFSLDMIAGYRHE